MKTLHFLSHYSHLPETFIYDEINRLETAWPDSNTILTFERLLKKERPYHDVVVLKTVPTFAQNMWRRCLRRIRRAMIPREDFPLRLYLARRLDSFDLIHVHFAWNALRLCRVLAQMGCQHRKPMVVQCHGSDIVSAPRLDLEYKRQLLDIAAQENVVFTAHSEFLTQKMTALGIPSTKIHRVANAFHPSFQIHRRQHLFKRGDCLRLINTARFIGWKGQHHLVKGFARFVREFYDNSVLTLIGDGETLSQTKLLAEQEGVLQKIRFLGSLPHHEVATQLSQNDLYIQPSIIDARTFQEEGLPIAVLEALAVGLPAIVTRTGGMPEIVGEENCFSKIIPERNSDAIFHALKELFESGACFQNMTLYSQARLNAFTGEQQLRDLTSAYSKILNRSGTCRI